MPLLFLEEYLDTIVALPNEVQRSLSLIKEQDALHQTCSESVHQGISRLFKENSKLSVEETTTLLDKIREGFIQGISHAEERAALAEHIHQSVKGHIVKLEDDLKHFEEEVRLAKLAESNKTIAHFNEPQQDEAGPASISPVVVNESVKQRRRTKSKEELQAASDAAAAANRKRSRGLSQPSSALEAAVNSVREEHPTSPPAADGRGEEATYCYCGQPSYGEMIGCDANSECELEWFHYGCVGLETPPKDQWFCPDCTARMARNPMAVGAAKSKEGGGKKPRPAFVR